MKMAVDNSEKRVSNMALLVKADGTRTEITLPPTNQLSTLQSLVGGMIELVPVLSEESKKAGYVDAICNEEGKILGLPVNGTASKMTGRTGSHGFVDYIAGDCLLCKKGEVK